MTEWSDADRALWILHNGWSESKVRFVHERVDDELYARVTKDSAPPWWSTARVLVRKVNLYTLEYEDLDGSPIKNHRKYIIDKVKNDNTN